MRGKQFVGIGRWERVSIDPRVFTCAYGNSYILVHMLCITRCTDAVRMGTLIYMHICFAVHDVLQLLVCTHVHTGTHLYTHTRVYACAREKVAIKVQG